MEDLRQHHPADAATATPDAGHSTRAYQRERIARQLERAFPVYASIEVEGSVVPRQTTGVR